MSHSYKTLKKRTPYLEILLKNIKIITKTFKKSQKIRNVSKIM